MKHQVHKGSLVHNIPKNVIFVRYVNVKDFFYQFFVVRHNRVL